MATFISLSLQTGRHFPAPKEGVISQVQRLERNNFSRRECLNFDAELKKCNSEFVVVLDQDDVRASGPALTAYMIFVHSNPGKSVWLHKVCVLEQFRRQKIAFNFLRAMADRYKGRGCSKIQLWVDEHNLPARGLYERVGFQHINKVENYYAPGRTGIQMTLDLLSP